MKLFDSLNKVGKTIKVFTSENDTQIKTGIGLGLLGASVGFAIMGTIRAVKAIENRKHELAVEQEDGVKVIPSKLPPKEVAKTVWKYYIPTAITMIGGVTAVIKSDVDSNKKLSIATAACALSETAYEELKDSITNTVGEKKKDEIIDNMVNAKIDKKPVDEVIQTGHGDTLMYDYLSGRYFYSDVDFIKRSINDLNKDMLCGDYMSLNDFYYAIGLGGIGLGDALGWRADRSLIKERIGSRTVDVHGKIEPCIELTFENMPRYGFDSEMR